MSYAQRYVLPPFAGINPLNPPPLYTPLKISLSPNCIWVKYILILYLGRGASRDMSLILPSYWSKVTFLFVKTNRYQTWIFVFFKQCYFDPKTDTFL